MVAFLQDKRDLVVIAARVGHKKLRYGYEKKKIEKKVLIHRGRCNNKVYYRLSHDVVT